MTAQNEQGEYMGVFYVLLLVPIVMQHVVIRGHSIDYEKKNKRILGLFFFWLTILVILRHESIGNDTSNYIYYFKNYGKMSWNRLGNGPLEVGFAIFMKFISLFSDNQQFFLAVVGITVNLLLYHTYKRLCVDASLTIVLFCTMSTFVMMFSGIRQMLAVGIGLIAYEFTRNKRLLPFILAICIALTIHTSAFILILMYPLYHVRITKKWLFTVVPVLVVAFVFNKQIFTILTLVIERYTRFEGGIVATGAYSMLLLFLAFTVFAFLIPDEALLDEEAIGLRNFLLLSLMIQMFAPLHNLAMRMNYYYIVFIPLLVPKIIENRSARWGQIAKVSRHIMVLFFLVFFFLNARGEGNLNVFPYYFCWESPV